MFIEKVKTILQNNPQEDIYTLLNLLITINFKDYPQDEIDLTELVKDHINIILNEVYKKFDDEETVIKEYILPITTNLVTIILNEKELPKVNEQSLNININDSLKIVYEFLMTINKDFAERFLNTMNAPLLDKNNQEIDKQIKFIYNSQEKGSYLDDKTGQIVIYYNNTSDDIIFILHEFVHQLAYQNEIEKTNIPRTLDYLLAEVPTITFEFLIIDYLKNLNYDLSYWLKERLHNTYESAQKIDFEYQLYKLYKENNDYIDLNIIGNYLQKDISKYQGQEFFDNFIPIIRIAAPTDKANNLGFYQAQEYVLGTLLACELYNKIKNKQLNIQNLVDLINILGNNDLNLKEDVKLLEKMKIPIIKNYDLIFNEKIKEELTSNYKTFIKDNLKENLNSFNKG